MDGQDLDRVLGTVLGTPFLGVAGLGHAPAQGAQDGGDVAAALLDGGVELAEETVEVRQPVGAEVARGFGGLDQAEPAQALDEDVGRLGLEGTAEDREMLDRGEKVLLPAFHPLDAGHVPRQHPRRAFDRLAQAAERLGGGGP